MEIALFLVMTASLTADAGNSTTPADAIARAVRQDDLASLDKLTRGAYLFENPSGQKMSITGKDVLAMLKGCDGMVINEPNDPKNAYGSSGHVLWTCAGHPSDSNACLDVGYGGIIRSQSGAFLLWLSRNDTWSKQRCGTIPAVVPPPPPRERGI